MALSDKKKIIAIMKKTCRHAYLASCDGDQPVIRSISPIVDNDMNIWIATFSKSRKVKQIKKNSRVCLYFVTQPNGEQIVNVMGKAKIIKTLKDKKHVWQVSHYDLTQYFPGGPNSKDFCLLKIIPTKIEWWPNWKVGRKVFTPK
mgnify:CR=1 FL=1